MKHRAFFSFLTTAAKHHLTHLEIFYENPSPGPKLTLSEEFRQILKRFRGRVSKFSLNLDLDLHHAIDFISDCELSSFDKVKLTD